MPTTRSTIGRAAARLAMLAAAVIAGACSGTELPIVAGFDGQWRVSELFVADGPVDLDAVEILVVIDTAAAAVRAETPCNVVLGSYTLLDDADTDDGESGEAGFTLPGTGTTPCAPADQQIQDSFVVAAEAVDRWSSDEGRLVFTSSSDGSRLVLTRLG